MADEDLRYRVFADGNEVAEFAELKDAKNWAVSLTVNYSKAEVYDLVKESTVYTIYDDGEEYEEYEEYKEDSIIIKFDRYAAVSGTIGNCKMGKKARQEILNALIATASDKPKDGAISFKAVANACGYKHVKVDDVRLIGRQFLDKMPNWKAVFCTVPRQITSLFCGLEFFDWDDEAIVEMAQPDDELDEYGRLR